ncbi:hypothetical protein NLJ89_g5705 [Agrocybe chaxingu]|uniref:Protein SQS1 n=1 Tax=Agrocybe chaxingu TaxID=84603 RepID=A0A9W8K0R3_9AGAR|nr:hypothetical protein NLJ89_g5705 [Agrocybe chaxingu]
MFADEEILRHGDAAEEDEEARCLVRILGRTHLTEVADAEDMVFLAIVAREVAMVSEDDSELLKPGVEDVDDTERSHVPTADSVSRVFSGGDLPLVESDSDEDEDAEEIEEVDFNEVGKLFDDSAQTKTTIVRKSKLSEATTVVEHQFTGFYVDTPPAVAANAAAQTNVDDLAKMVEETLSATDEPNDIAMADEPAPSHENLFFIDTAPTPIPTELAPTGHSPPTVLLDDDDDIIVYVAPHPRNTTHETKEDTPEATTGPQPDTSHFSPYARPGALPSQPEAASSSSANPPPPPPIPEPPSLSSIAFSFSKTATPARLATPPISTPRQAKIWKRKRERGFARKKKGKLTSFGAFGAMREEALLHNRDPRRAERRKGDSDLEWGDTDDDETADDVEEVFASLRDVNGDAKVDTKGKGKARDDNSSLKNAEEDVHGMDIDPDMQMDLTAMKSFVGGLLGSSAGQHTTMADIVDAAVMQIEDEDNANEEERGSSGEEEEKEEDLMKAEEDMIIAEALEFSDEDEDEDEDEEDEDQTPRTSFQARLERLREKARSKKPEDESFDYYMDDDSEEDSDDGWPDFSDQARTAAERDEAFIQEIQDMLDDNADILEGRNRKERKKLFMSVRNGAFDDEGSSPAKRSKDKGKDLPPGLRAQWEKDRQKKAEYKKARELARLEAAADPLSKKKGGKKGRKAMQAAAALDPTITVIPNRIIDMTTLVQQIQRFIADIGGPKEMALPPTNKETRKNIHEMAIAFNLKSISKGKGDARYTTLTKTTRSGFGVNESKVAKIVRRSGGMGARGDSFIYDKKGRSGGGPKMPRHRDGDEVGGTAPKLNESNIGFRMLAMMGWAEGIRIGGATGGLDAPLTAIIKNSKLGLGATK